MARAALTRAAGTVAFLTVVSRVFGFTREASLAAVFGATQDTDAYLMAQVIPLLFLRVVRHALITTFIPVYSHVRAKHGEVQAFRLANTVIRLVILVGVVMVLLGEVFAEHLVNLVAPGFSGSLSGLTAYLSRIMFPMVVFHLVSGIATGILQSDGQFAIPETAALVQNVAVIVATLAFGPHYGIVAVAVGLLVGEIGSLLIKIPALNRAGFRWEQVFDVGDPGLQRIIVLMVPAIIGAGATQINTLIDRILASSLPEGRVAALNYAVRLSGLAPGILGGSLVTVIYPTLAKAAAREDWQGFANDLIRSLGTINFMLAPIAAGTVVLREPLVRIVYERGAFGALATQETAWALMFLAVGMGFTSMYALMGRAFFALQDTLTPLYIGLATVVVNVIANFILIGPLAQGGLALGTSGAGLFGLILSISIMRRKSPVGLPVRPLISSMLRVFAAAILMGVLVWLAYPPLQNTLSSGSIRTDILAVLFTVLLGGLIYGVLLFILRVPELKHGLRILHRFLQRLA